MKITVKVDNQSYAVEVGDIHDRPVIAVVEGEAFEVWPEEVVISHPSTHSHAVPLQAAARPAPQSTPAPQSAAPKAAAPTAGVDNAKAVRAPIPGVIISVAVKAGDVVYVPADHEHQFRAGQSGMTFLCLIPMSRNCGDPTPGS